MNLNGNRHCTETVDVKNIHDIKDGFYFLEKYGCIPLVVRLFHTHKKYGTAIDYLVTNLSFIRLGLVRYMLRFDQGISMTQLNNATLNLYSPYFNFAYCKNLGFTPINNLNGEVNKNICSYFKLVDEPCHDVYAVFTKQTLFEMKITNKTLAVTKYLDNHIKKS